jgi:transcriptional regulator with XRE-family HTH domain
MATVEAVRAAVARSVRVLRTGRGLTLEQLALRSGVSKGMIVEIEQERTNPSIATLCQLAEALGTTVPAMVEVSEQPSIRVVRAADRVRLWAGAAGGAATLLAGSEGRTPVELWEWMLESGDVYSADAHAAGTREMLHVLEGTLALHVGHEETGVTAGDTVLFRADRPHSYGNAETCRTRFLMVILQPESRGEGKL